MHVNVRVIGQELLNRFGFMGGEVVGDHVDLFGFGLTGHKLSQKLDKLSTAMTGCGLAQHLPGAGIEGGIQRRWIWW